MTDYLGDVAAAFQELEKVSPSKAGVKIDNNDSHSYRYGVTLWNVFGSWSASKSTLAESIREAIRLASEDLWGEKP